MRTLFFQYVFFEFLLFDYQGYHFQYNSAENLNIGLNLMSSR